jgi:ribosomal protein S18 acetylase RimI-like enzyme
MIHRATAADVESVRSIRLAALRDAPRAFTTSYEQAAALSDEVWLDRLQADAHPTFLWSDAGGPHGMVVALHLPDEPQHVHLVAMWVRPSARRHGAGAALVSRVVEWAREQQVSAVRLEVVDDNESAERLYRRCGFGPTGRTRVREHDGAVLVEMEYRLDVV